jgi:hypothetical protein
VVRANKIKYIQILYTNKNHLYLVSGAVPSAAGSAIGAASHAMSGSVPSASVSVSRPYAGPSVISAANQLQFSFAVGLLGLFAFYFVTL